MSTRNDRRQAQKDIKKKLRNPHVRRILKEEARTGGSTEIYRLDDDGSGRPMYFNISAMRAWAEQHLRPHSIPPDPVRASRLVESGAVDLDYVREHTIQKEPKPIIICRGLFDGDYIVDGAHRFVALCMGAATFDGEAYLPGYVLEPAQWRPFVIPPGIARACGAI